MQIPKRFKLFGQTIKVEISTNSEDKEGNQGTAYFNKNHIVIQCSKVLKRPNSRMEQVYLHEMFHIIFNELHYPKETFNEQMVDQMASALHQILITSEYK